MNSGKTVLIVDGQRYDGGSLKEALQPNYRVIETADCDAAAEIAESERPDLVIIDVDIPERKGLELCELLKDASRTRDIPVILASAMTEVDDVILGLRAGASDYIAKPFCLPEIVARVESHLRTQDYYAELEHRDLLLLLELSETISVTRSPNAILGLIVKKMSNIFDVARCSVIGLGEDERVVVKASSDLEKNQEVVLDIHRYPEISAAIRSKQSLVINDIKNDPLMAPVRKHIENLDYNSVVVIPLIKKESVIGTFFLRAVTREVGGISARIHKLCQLVANIAANALENAVIFESVKTAQEFFAEMSIRDDLTRLYNRRHFYERLREELGRTKRYAAPVSLLFVDVDDFKRINDDFGHTQGDRVLKTIGRLLKTAARVSDIPARFGGDEFAMILPNTDYEGAQELALRIFSRVNGCKIAGLRGETVSISMGVATCVAKNVITCDELIKQADQAMYRSKAAGKGRVSYA